MTTRGIEHVAAFAGLDATTSPVASNSGTIFSGLPSLYNHSLPGVTANSVLADLRTRLSVIKDAYVLTIPPPPVQGLGSAGGFKMMLEDRAGLGPEALVRLPVRWSPQPTRILTSPAYSRCSTPVLPQFTPTSTA
jgi:multidrug efflux pump subunit AcrB